MEPILTANDSILGMERRAVGQMGGSGFILGKNPHQALGELDHDFQVIAMDIINRAQSAIAGDDLR
jgi:hypothetical protein